MRDCRCGTSVVLRVARLTFDRRRGVTHWIEHWDGSKVCEPGPWSCVAFKPYPNAAEMRESSKLLRGWAARGEARG